MSPFEVELLGEVRRLRDSLDGWAMSVQLELAAVRRLEELRKTDAPATSPARPLPRILTRHRAAAHLHMATKRLARLVELGLVQPVFDEKGRQRFPLAELERYVADLPKTRATTPPKGSKTRSARPRPPTDDAAAQIMAWEPPATTRSKR